MKRFKEGKKASRRINTLMAAEHRIFEVFFKKENKQEIPNRPRDCIVVVFISPQPSLRLDFNITIDRSTLIIIIINNLTRQQKIK